MIARAFVAFALLAMDLVVWWAFGRERYETERRISRRTTRGEYI